VSSTSAIDIRRFIDDRPVSRYQLLVAVMCGLIVFVDGFDAQAMGYVAPALSTAMQIPRSVLGPVISSGLVGMMIGAMVSGGGRLIRRMALVTEDGGLPCGLCLQSLREFGLKFEIAIYAGTELRRTVTLSELLPEAFASDRVNRT
jgi:hypothetical protein